MNNKRKKWWLIVVAFVLTIVMVGCGTKKDDTTKVGEVFINRFIYNEDKEEFKELFVDGDTLGKQLQLMVSSFQNNFSEVFDPIVGTLDEREKNEIVKGLMKKVKTTTSFETKMETKGKDQLIVTYQIKGFDYASLVEKTLTNLLTQITTMENESDVNKKEAVMVSFFDALNEVTEPTKQVDVSLTFEQEKKQWVIKEGQDKEIHQIMLAFLTGTHNDKEYNEQMKQVIEGVVKEADSKL